MRSKRWEQIVVSNKYELTNYDADIDLHQIKALRDIPESNVKKGDLGGFVQSEANLSQEGSCWVFDQAMVFGSARVSGSARVFGSARLRDFAQVIDSAVVFGKAKVSGSAIVGGYAVVRDSAQVSGEVVLGANDIIYGGAKVNKSIICEHSREIRHVFILKFKFKGRYE